MNSTIDFKQVWEVLEMNQLWQGCYGKRGEPPLTTEEKKKICAVIYSKLKKSILTNGQDFFSELWIFLKPALIKMDWFARKPNGELWGPYMLWNVTYRKSSLMAQKKIESRVKPIKTVIDQVLDEILEPKKGVA